jgi:hypothetical protein
MNKGERQRITRLKFIKRLKLLRNKLEPLREGHLEGNFYAFKTTGTPCSCFLCRREKYNRNVKHKISNFSAENYQQFAM